MAKIAFNDKAPADAKTVSFAQDNYEVPFESDDPVVLANAAAHPWLDVEVDASLVDPPGRSFEVLPGDDRSKSLANDPEAAAAAEAEKEAAAVGGVLAVEAGLDQNQPEFVGEEGHEVPVTLAADDVEPATTEESN